MDQYLVISIVGSNRNGIVNELAKLTHHSGCHFADTHIHVLGNEFAGTLLVYGPWAAIAKLEASLPGFATQHELNIDSRRTQMPIMEGNTIPYMVHIVTLEEQDLIPKITNFFHQYAIDTIELSTHRYRAQLTGATMFSLLMSIHIPHHIKIADLRENFILFCEDHNLDAILEPEKN